MNCRKCGKEIQAGYQFCPFCGTKDPAKEEQLVLRNTDWLRLATMEELEAFLPELKSMTAEELSMWRCGMHENIRIFQIKVNYTWSQKYHNEIERRRSSIRGFSAKDTEEQIKRISLRGDAITEISVVECNLSGRFKETDDGITWFRTTEECKTAISKIKIPRTESGEKNG